jgi:hypothetical protein
MPQDPLLQVAVPPAGVRHAVHMVPHVIGLLLSTQLPEQSCMPVGHVPSHERPSAMHAPAQIFVPLGQTGLHSPAMQLAVPPIGTVHGIHAMPQLIGEVSLRHSLSQRCWPVAHLHMPDSHVAPVAQSIAVQQLASGMHSVLHIFWPVAHIGVLD